MTKAPNQPRILVADDDPDIVHLWTRILQWGCGAEVAAVFDGSAAIARLEAERFDVVVTDLRMPGASGLDVIRSANQRDPPVPVILATGDAAEHVLAEAVRLGARGVLIKPFRLDEAVALAREVLRVRAQANASAS